MPDDSDNTQSNTHGSAGSGGGEKDAEAAKLERRRFFSEGFRSLMKPLSEILESRLDHIQRTIEESRQAALGSLGPEEVPEPSYYSYGDAEYTRLLRPPGALAEDLFLDRCGASNQCVSACPVQAIQVMESEDPRLSGTPFIDPLVQACVVCDDLSCMKVCPTGALQLVPREEIRIGIAEMREDTCLRTVGDDCRICVEKCPIGAAAIEVAAGDYIEVHSDGCIGCGVCEMYCPTEPRSIVTKEIRQL